MGKKKKVATKPAGFKLKLVRIPSSWMDKLVAHKKKNDNKKGFSVEEQIRGAIKKLPQMR